MISATTSLVAEQEQERLSDSNTHSHVTAWTYILSWFEWWGPSIHQVWSWKNLAF